MLKFEAFRHVLHNKNKHVKEKKMALQKRESVNLAEIYLMNTSLLHIQIKYEHFQAYPNWGHLYLLVQVFPNTDLCSHVVEFCSV